MNELIIGMINQNKSVREICYELRISEKQFFVYIKRLINNGYLLKPSYLYNSDIYYNKQNNLSEEEKNNIRINIPKDKSDFRCLVISDLHIGNKYFDMDLIKKVYEYASKNNINIIFNCGDFIEGIHAFGKLNIDSTLGQIEYLIKKYPYDVNIRNFVIFGNHDYHSILHEELDISKKITQSRFDIVSIGYGKGIVNLKDDNILLQHELSVVENPQIGNDINIILVGHGHMMKTKLNGKFVLCVPSLSYVSPDRKKEIVPGFIDLSMSFDKKKIEYIEAKHLILNPNVQEVAISKCKVNVLSNNTINNYKKR